MTWTNWDSTMFEDGDTLSETNLQTYIGDNFNALLHPLNINTADRDVANSTSELSFWSTTAGGFSVPANTLGANGNLTVEAMGDMLFNNAAANTLTLRIRFGGATVLTPLAAAPGSATSATRVGWFLRVVIANRGATNSQIVITSGSTTFITAAAPGYLNLSAQATAAVDTTANQTFDMTAQWNAASVNNSWKKVWAVARVARN